MSSASILDFALGADHCNDRQLRKTSRRYPGSCGALHKSMGSLKPCVARLARDKIGKNSRHKTPTTTLKTHNRYNLINATLQIATTVRLAMDFMISLPLHAPHHVNSCGRYELVSSGVCHPRAALPRCDRLTAGAPHLGQLCASNGLCYIVDQALINSGLFSARWTKTDIVRKAALSRSASGRPWS